MFDGWNSEHGTWMPYDRSPPDAETNGYVSGGVDCGGCATAVSFLVVASFRTSGRLGVWQVVGADATAVVLLFVPAGVCLVLRGPLRGGSLSAEACRERRNSSTG